MGEVFLAAQKSAAGIGPPIALKVLRQELASDSSFVSMMIDEAKISMFLNHQNIVSVLDFAEEDGAYYIAMEFVQGATVERLVDVLRNSKRQLDPAIALFIGIEICRALKYAHACTNHLGEALNIVHRDVTPANVLLSIQGEVKLTDFGIARAAGRIHQTQAGVVKGKFGYLAPEIARYENIDGRADLFALGVVLYQLLAGQHPVQGASVMEAIFRFEEKEVPLPSSLNPEVPASVEQIVMRALEPKPENRWSSAQELQVALQDAAMADPKIRRGMPSAAHSLAMLLKELVPEVFENPVPPEMKRDPTLPPGYAGFSTQLFSTSSSDAPVPSVVPQPRLPSLALRQQSTLPGTQNARSVQLVPGRSADTTTDPSARSGLAFGESTTHDMPQLPDPLREDTAPSSFESKTVANDFGAETSQDIPLLPDPGEPPSTDFGESTRVDRAYAAPQISSSPTLEPLIDGSGFGDRTLAGFGDRTLADGAFRALHDPAQTIQEPKIDVSPTETSDSSDAFGASTVADPQFRGLVPNSGPPLGKASPPASASRSRTNDNFDDEPLEATAVRAEAVKNKLPPPKLKWPEPKPIEVPLIATTVDPELPSSDELELLSSDDPFGSNTEKWAAGKLEAKELSWNDEDAARRAVATRNIVRGVPSTPEHPAPRAHSVAQSPQQQTPASPFAHRTAVAVRSTSQSTPVPRGYSSPALGAATSRSAPVSNFAPPLTANDAETITSESGKKRGVLIAILVALVAAATAIAAALIYPTMFAPTLDVSTTPPGATVLINGLPAAGTTPLSINVAPDRELRVELSLPGHQPVVREVSGVERGQTYAINIELAPLEPELRIAPNGGRVSLNDKEIGFGSKVKLTGVDPNAPAVVRVEANGFETFHREWTRGSEIPAILDVELKKL